MRAPQWEPLTYGKHLESTGDYATADDHIQRWTGTHWAQQPSEDAVRDALRWMDSNSSAIASDAAAASAVRTAVSWLPKLSPPDDDELLIPLKNGYLRYRGGAFHLDPHDRSLRIRYLINCEFNPGAAPPALFRTFVERILPDVQVRERVQEYLGYTLLPGTRAQRAALWVGDGANGKGTLARIAQALHQRVASVRLDDLAGFGLESLVDASLIYCDEAPKTGAGEEIMKTLVAGELAPIRRKFKSTLSTAVKAKWLICANTVPRIKDKSDGFWRRMDIVPFDVQIPDGEKDPMLHSKILRSELAGVLLWFLEGLARFLNRGCFDPVKPPAMLKLDRLAKASSNPLKDWVDEKEITLGKTGATSKATVYATYREWAEANGYKRDNAGDFWDALQKVLGPISETRAFHGRKRLRMCNVVL